MIRVALHVVAGPRGGPRTYGVALATALARRDDVDLVVLTDCPEAFDGIATVRLGGPRPWCDHVKVPRLLKELEPDVYHNTKNALPRRLPCASVVTLHDLAYHHHPETFGFLARLYLKWHHEQAARRADVIVAVSHHARHDIARTLGITGDNIHVVYHGVDRSFLGTPDVPFAGLAEPYVLSVGTIQRRKNLDILVRAAARLRAAGHDFTLAIAGRRGWKTEEFDRACEETPVRILGLVPDESLPTLYRHAAAFVQPSSYEGFGLTALEAMASGAPVIAAEAGSLPEVVGDAGLLVPPRDVDALSEALAKVLDHPGLAEEMRAAGRERSNRFSWDQSAAEHVAAYCAAARRWRQR
ncbi:MAG: glycosyltransferase family 4 protein [Planctomycetota bacterium]|jgi:glycosyltransferase involved in cell wall biosynthesis